MRFYEISSPTLRLELRTQGNEAFLALQVEDERGDGLLEEDIQLVYVFLGLTSFVGRPFPVRWVGTRDPQHVGRGANHYVIGAPVRLHRCTGLAFPRTLLASPPRADFAEFGWQPIGRALDLLAGAAGPWSAANNRDFCVGRLAAEQGVAPSTIRRKLTRDAGGFRKVREQALVETALQQLTTRTCSVDAVAADLGYADARSLRRFLKRATGYTPEALRQRSAVVPLERLQARFREIIGVMPL